MNGVLVVDKPPGPTSHDVVAVVRRSLGERRIGHTGTLDPLATGVLPLVIGRATRLASLLTAAEKEYIADIRFGGTTPTFDADGRLAYNPDSGLMEAAVPPPDEPPGLNADVIEGFLAGFRGTYLQEPPVFSAKKSGGVRAYRKARQNERPTLEPVSVTVGLLVLEHYAHGLGRFRLRSSSGFYVRALARDLGNRIGCGAYLEGLRRTSAAGFTLADAVSLESIARHPERAVQQVVDLERLLPDLPSVVLNERGAQKASHGNTLTLADLAVTSEQPPVFESPPPVPGGESRVRVFDRSGSLLAIAQRFENGLLHPTIVLV